MANPADDVPELAHIDPIDDDMETTSDYDGSEASSGFTSADSVILAHYHEYGRRYQTFRMDKYPLPNDETEQEREQMKHDLMKLVLDKKDFLAPIGDSPQKILDLGTGSGIWCMDVAEKYPSAHIIGVDLSAIQTQWPCINVDFRVDDIEDDWPPLYSDLDFVHCRAVIQTLRNPLKVIESAYSNLKPGGWIEFQEASGRVSCDDGTVTPSHPLKKFLTLYAAAFKTHYGWDISYASKLPDVLAQVGFTNIQQKQTKLPIGSWAEDKRLREIGLYLSDHILWELVRAVMVKYVQLGLTKEEADVLSLQIKNSFKDRSIHPYMKWYSVWAQKPVN